MQIKYERGIKCISYPKPGKIWAFILLQCTSSSPKIYSDPHFSVYKGQKMQCIIPYGDPTRAGYTASSQIEVEKHSYML